MPRAAIRLLLFFVACGPAFGAADKTGVDRPGAEWVPVHEVDIFFPQSKQKFGRVEVLLDKSSVRVDNHDVYYRVRQYRKSQTSESDVIEQRVSDCQAGRYKVTAVTNIRSGETVQPREHDWQKPRQPQVLALEKYICEKLCGLAYPENQPSAAATCPARSSPKK